MSVHVIKVPDVGEGIAEVELVAWHVAPGDAIADCSPMDWWVSGHLMGFLWDAKRVDCEMPAAWRFDGRGVAVNGGP